MRGEDSMRTWQPEVPGGIRLRSLREDARKTQLWVEVESGLGTGYLQRVESGKIAQPERSTLEKILAALGARYSERREVLELFGYKVTTAPPTDDELEWASDVCRHELHDVPFPAYVLDCTHRILTWNRSVPLIFGLDPGDASLGGLYRSSLLAAWFDSASPISALVAEPDVFLPALVRALRYEMQQFRTDSWYHQLLMQLQHDLPDFRHYWRVVEQEPSQATATRALVPVKLSVPGVGDLQFRLSSEPFLRDARFRVVYFFPADPRTMEQCAIWNAALARE